MEKSYLGFAEYLDDGRISVQKECGKTRFCNPCRLGDVLFGLRSQVGRVGVQHVVPPGVLEVPLAVAYVDQLSLDEYHSRYVSFAVFFTLYTPLLPLTAVILHLVLELVSSSEL